MNSKFRNQIFIPVRHPKDYMHLINREHCEGEYPHMWLMSDWKMIEESPYFWARKFDLNKDRELIEKVFEIWR